jgi:Rps23 Pro-64 3,4-dihydroxylase Tpa1-like proline 4-hydroxylase
MKNINIFDNALPPVVLEAVQNHFQEHVRWKFGWPQGTKDPFSHWNIDFLNASLRNQTDMTAKLLDDPALQAVADVWRALIAGPLKGHELVRCYANAHTYGVEGRPHTDVMSTEDGTQKDNYTAVVYLNPVWKTEWAGELVMFDQAGDSIMAILPRSGRVAIIPGEMLHAARAVSRDCPSVRVCVAFKSRLPSAGELAARA